VKLQPYRTADLAQAPWRASEDRYEFGSHVSEALREQGPAFTLWDTDNRPLGAAGVVLMHPGVAEAWIWVSAWLDERCHGIAAARACRMLIDGMQRSRRIRRLQAIVMAGDGRAYRFARWLNFEPEGTLREFGPKREDFIMLARIIRI
jgi:RimJ/RimL family protein N-acetyltransferase